MFGVRGRGEYVVVVTLQGPLRRALNFEALFYTRFSASENVDRIELELANYTAFTRAGRVRDHLHKPCLLRSSDEGTLDGYVARITEFSMFHYVR